MSNSGDTSNNIQANNSNNNIILQNIINSVIVIIKGFSIKKTIDFIKLLSTEIKKYHIVFGVTFLVLLFSNPINFIDIDYKEDAAFIIYFIQTILVLIPIADIAYNMVIKYTK